MNFDTKNLQSENRALKSQIDKFESGEAYTKLEKKHDLEIERLDRAHKKEIKGIQAAHAQEIKEFRTQIKEKDAEIRELRKTVETLKSMYEKSEARIRKMELTQKMNPAQDPLLEEMIREQSEMIENLKKQIDGLSEIITKKDEIIKKQEIQIRKDYTNSSLPSSSDPNHKPIRNGRVKSGRKKGGQKNHKGHKRKEAASDTIIILNQEPEQVRENPDDYILLPEIRSRKMVSLRLVREVTEYKALVWKNVKTGRKVSAEFPANCVNEINYDESVKAFLLILTCYMNVSIRKAQDFLYNISEGTLNVSTGSICNLRAEFERKSKEERDQIWNCLHNSKVMGSDTTFTRVKGTTAYFGVHINEEAVYYTAGKKKGLELVRSSPLEGYEGISVHDSEATYFRHGNLHQQCIVHLFRYLRLIEEFEPQLTWSKRMHNLLQSITQETEKRKKEMDPADWEKPVFTEEELERIRSTYDEILQVADREYPVKSEVFKDGYNTASRLRKQKESVLCFLEHPWVPWHNNDSETAARTVKRKTKQSDGFKSIEGAREYASFMTVAGTARLRGKNVYKVCQKIMAKASPARRKRMIKSR